MKRGLFWCDVPGTFIEFCFMIFTEVLIKDSARMLIHVRESFNCRVSFKMLLPMFLVNFEKKFKQSCDQVTFRMLRSNKITKTVTKVVLNQASLFTLVLNKNDNNEHLELHEIVIPLKDEIYSKQGSHISLLFGTRTFWVLFPNAGVQPEIFQGRGGFVELRHFDNHFVKNTRKKGPAGKNFGVFSPRYC